MYLKDISTNCNDPKFLDIQIWSSLNRCKKKKSCFWFPDRPIKFVAIASFFQPLGKQIIIRRPAQTSAELPKAPEINVLICFCVIHLTIFFFFGRLLYSIEAIFDNISTLYGPTPYKNCILETMYSA